jgi:restriction endonuclease S subunit
LVQKGAKNTINISNSGFLNGSELLFPVSEVEQTKIANILSSIDDKIKICTDHISKLEFWKKGLLQRMFC